MSQSATTGGLAHRRPIGQADRAARLQRAPETAARVDPDTLGGRDKPANPPAIVGHHHRPDELARVLDFRRAHLGEILGAQDFLVGYGEPRVEIDQRDGLRFFRLRLEERVGDPARARLGRSRRPLARRLRRHHRNQLFEQAPARPEGLERLVEEKAVLMLLDEHRVQRGAEVTPIAEAHSLDRGERVQHRARAERHAGLAKRAGEMDDIFGERAAADRRRFGSVVHGAPPFSRVPCGAVRRGCRRSASAPSRLRSWRCRPGI